MTDLTTPEYFRQALTDPDHLENNLRMCSSWGNTLYDTACSLGWDGTIEEDADVGRIDCMDAAASYLRLWKMKHRSISKEEAEAAAEADFDDNWHEAIAYMTMQLAERLGWEDNESKTALHNAEDYLGELFSRERTTGSEMMSFRKKKQS